VFASLRQVARGLRRSPASSIAAIVTLALSFASATAIFAVVDATLLVPPPFHDPEALTVIGEVPANAPASVPRAVSTTTYDAWRARLNGAVRLEAYDPTNVTFTGGQFPERLAATAVTPGFFALLGINPRVGRPFSEREAADGTAVILSDEFWRTRLFADPNPLGKTVTIAGQPRSIVGVLPQGVSFGLSPSVLWLPLNAAPGNDSARVRVIGRVATGVTLRTATALLQTGAAETSSDVHPAALLLRTVLSGRAAETMPLLLIAAGLGIALAAINLAGLMMLRALDRSRELAVRAALGATRKDLLKPLLIETHVLVMAGAAFGVLLALWIMPTAAQLATLQLGSSAARISIEWRAVAWLLVLSLGCAWFAALVPSLVAVRRFDLTRIGREQTPAPRSIVTMRRVFVAAEIAVAFVLVAAVLLVGRSLRAVIAIEPGFVPDHVLTAQVSIPSARYRSNESIAAFYQQLEGNVTARLGRGHVAIVDELPLTGSTAGRIRVASTTEDRAHDAVARVAGSTYFALLQIPLVDGRAFDDRDAPGATPKVVISRSLADLLYPNTAAPGRTLWIASANQRVEVLGVVGDVKHRALEEEPMPTLYFSAAQQPSNSNHLVLKTDRSDADTLDIVRSEVARLDPQVPVYAARTLDEIVQTSAGVPVRRVISATFAAFALLALVIAAVGVFGVVAHDVSARRLELALRLALGAHPGRLQHAVLRQASGLLAAGLATGMALSLLLSRTLHVLLYGVTPTDAVTLAAVTALLSATMLAAACVPARRAARTNPLDIFRVA
jgi:putative ABC transport system permease protein